MSLAKLRFIITEVVAPAVTATLVGMLVISCMSAGAKVTIVAPEKLPAIDEVAVWPVTVIPWPTHLVEEYSAAIDTMFEMSPSFRKRTVDLGIDTEDLLVRELARTKLFTLIKPDSVVGSISSDDWIDFRLGRYDWHNADKMPDVEYIIVTEVFFKRKSFYQRGTSGIATRIELSVYHLSLIHISEPTRLDARSRMPSSA